MLCVFFGECIICAYKGLLRAAIMCAGIGYFLRLLQGLIIVCMLWFSFFIRKVLVVSELDENAFFL